GGARLARGGLGVFGGRQAREVLSPLEGGSHTAGGGVLEVAALYGGGGNGTQRGRCEMRGRNARAGESAQAPASRKAFTLPASGKRAARQVDEEFEFHLKERVDELVEGGMDRAAAEAEVRRRFGDLASLRRETVAIDRRSARRAGWSDVLGDTEREVRD